MATNQTTQIQITGTLRTRNLPNNEVEVTDEWQGLEIRSNDFATREEAEELVAKFPKSYNLKVIKCYRQDGNTYSVQNRVDLVPNDTNDGINETGLARARKIAKKAAQLDGVDAVFSTGRFINSADADAVEALVG